MAREASTLSLATCHAGFSRRGIDPVGETFNVPDTPLGSRHLVVSRPPPRTGDIHGHPQRAAEKTTQTEEAGQA